MALKKSKSPAKKQSKRDLPSLKKAAFLAAYAKTGNITAAAKVAKVNRGQHYDWLLDPDYERAFASAHQEAAELLELEARRRAMEGVHEPVIYQGALQYEAVRDKTGAPKLDPETGEALLRPLTIRRYSDTLLIFLLKGAKPETYRETFKGEIKHSGAIGRGPDLSNLTDEQLEQLEQLAKAAAEPGSHRSGEASPGPE